MLLKQNTIIPKFTSIDDQKQNFTDKDLITNQYNLLYFYPADDTPGCTIEANAMKSMFSKLNDNNIQVIGISTDMVKSHQNFKNKYDLPFTLIADETKEVTNLFGALDDNGMARRVSYLIDNNGKILKTYESVNPINHTNQVLEDVKNIKK